QASKQVQQALGRITGQASEFQKSLDASTARVFAFGATTAVLNGVTQSFKKLVSTTIEVEKRLIEINSIFQATDATFSRFRASIFRVAKETGQTFDTVAEGAAELARQGLSAEETAKRLKAALVMTRISGMDAEKSVKALTAAINGFTSASLTANQIVNKMVAVDTAFAVSTDDLAAAFTRAGSTAEDAGVSFDELLGLITAVEQRTARGGAVIGNAFKS
ncbi:MAG TPA: phage tail tape measure protein, partial [Balneola sp.]|nr:phage tail tape measure protein [Balneola sp.]